MQTTNPTTIYIAKPAFLSELCEEISDATHIVENLVFSPSPCKNVCFALDTWRTPQVVEVTSISHAAKILRQAGKYWYLNPVSHVRRSRLIEEQLPKLPALERQFPFEKEIPPIGCFSLLDQNTLVFSTDRAKKWPLGECRFIEDKQHPPNRAYLKLWEALTILNRLPTEQDRVLDLGASPGGWTYVMQSLGARVTAIDKAELDPAITALPRVTFLQQSAFALDIPEWSQKIDWLIGDIACYPDRLYEFLTKWLSVKPDTKQIILTIKLQGKTDLEMIRKFQAIPGASVQHLFYNKHEATFFYPAPK